MSNDTIIGFCPDCGEPIYSIGLTDDGTNYGDTIYICEGCGGEFTSIIEPEYEISDKVYWNDPCQEPNEDDTMYEARCSVVRTITDILYIDGNTTEDIVYELDDGTEVNGCELEYAD